MSRPETPGAGEKVKWTRGAGSLVNLSEAHSTFVLGYGVCVTCSDSGGFFFFGYVCGCGRAFGTKWSTVAAMRRLALPGLGGGVGAGMDGRIPRWIRHSSLWDYGREFGTK